VIPETVLLCYPPFLKGTGLYKKWCKGWAFGGGRTAVDVPYSPTLAARSIINGVAALDTALKTTPGDVVAMGHSQGAQVISRWLRHYADAPDAPDPLRVRFVLTGNPLRANTGRIIGMREVDGVVGQPTRTNTRYRVLDVARRYDGWAIKGPTFSRNGVRGMAIDHCAYWNVDLDAPSVPRPWSDEPGTTTYLTVD